MAEDMKFLLMNFTCPKCYSGYKVVSGLTISSRICANCREAIIIPSYIPKEQYNEWWRNYKWQKI